MDETSSNASTNETRCTESDVGYDFVRFFLVVYVGTPIAFFGVICNFTLLRLFSKARARKSPILYLLVLAILDLLMDLIYIPFLTTDALAVYNGNVMLHDLWHRYAMFLFGSSRMVQFASTYVVLCATIERFIVVAEIHSLDFLVSEVGRYATVGVVFFGVFLLRVPAFYEYTVEYYPECPAFQNYMVQPLLAAYANYQYYNFYVMSVLHIFVPFALLLLLNISIVAVTKRKLRHIGWAATTFIDMPKITELIRKGRFSESQIRTRTKDIAHVIEERKSESISSAKKRRDELRYATWTMVSIVTSYLCCSTFSLFISIMENYFPDNWIMVDPETGESTPFYTLTTDVCSILVALNSLLRLFIYMLCSPSIRQELVKECPIFGVFVGRWPLPPYSSFLCCRRGFRKTANVLSHSGARFGDGYQQTLIAGFQPTGQMV